MAGSNSKTSFLDAFLKDELDCRYTSTDDFGCQPDNENNDIPLYDQYNRGLTLCEQGMDRENLTLEGAKRMKRPGVTGYIPSMEESDNYSGTNPKPNTLLIALGKPSKEMEMASMMRRGLIQ